MILHCTVLFPLNMYRKLQFYYKSISFHGGATGLHHALNHVLNDLLTPEYGDREDAENVLVLMTDGGTTNPLETFTAIDRLG